jgi:predicted protein tyrosine phosphatase
MTIRHMYMETYKHMPKRHTIMRSITLRIEAILKEQIQKMSEQSERNTSEVFRDLIDLGIGYQQESPIIIKGARGIRRSFSKLSYGDETTRISLHLDEEQIEEALKTFHESETGAVREAIRLGFIMIHADEVRFTNPRAQIFPFKVFKLTSFNNKRAQKALENLTDK